MLAIGDPQLEQTARFNSSGGKLSTSSIGLLVYLESSECCRAADVSQSGNFGIVHRMTSDIELAVLQMSVAERESKSASRATVTILAAVADLVAKPAAVFPRFALVLTPVVVHVSAESPFHRLRTSVCRQARIECGESPGSE